MIYVQALLESECDESTLYHYMPELIAVLDSRNNDLLPTLKSIGSVQERAAFLLNKRELKIVMKDVRAVYPKEKARSEIIDLKICQYDFFYTVMKKDIFMNCSQKTSLNLVQNILLIGFLIALLLIRKVSGISFSKIKRSNFY